MGNTGIKQHYDTASKTGVLQLSKNKIKEIPDEALKLSDTLRNLDLSKNKISIIDNISKFKLLKQLNLETNKIEKIPNSIGNLKKLELFNISNNLVSQLPDTFSLLVNLKQVYINNNKLKVFPRQLLGISCLEVLELSNNKITEIPNGMHELYAAELNLSQNEISIIGEDLHMAPKLKILRLEENCLSIDTIKPSLLRDSKIHTINLDGNLFDSKQLEALEGYNEYTERYAAVKKKMF